MQATAAAVEFRILIGVERASRVRRAVGAALMHGNAARIHVGGALERGARHAERREDVILEIRIEPLAARGFTALPTQSMPMEYSQRSPGSNTSGDSRALLRPVRAPGRPVASM